MAAEPTYAAGSAREVWHRALDAQSALQVDRAAVLYRAATQADPTLLAAHLDYIDFQVLSGRLAQLRVEYAARGDVPAPLSRCLRAHLAIQPGNGEASVPVFYELLRSDGPSPCVHLGLARMLAPFRPGQDKRRADRTRFARAAAAAHPEYAPLSFELIGEHQRAGRFEEAIAEARRTIARSEHPLHRVRMRQFLVSLLEQQGDSVAAHAEGRDIDAEIARHGPSTLTFWRYQWATPARVDGVQHLRARARIAAGAGASDLAAATIADAVGGMVGGRPRDALAELRPWIGHVERAKLYPVALKLRLFEGRALRTAGEVAPAIGALRMAADAAAKVGSEYYLAEVHHQLAHAHEALGRWEVAVREADAFARHAQRTHDPGIRVISYHDAGEIRWKAGWHAAADSMYRLMVRTIEHEDAHYAYAGEYYERVGDLDRAIHYYDRARTPDALLYGGDHKVILSGLVRLHLAFGRPDSALATARLHDSIVAEPYDDILVPRVLARIGQGADAVETMRRWARRRAEIGNVRGHVRSLVGLAEALNAMPRPDARAALAVALEAESLALRHNLAAERISALRLRAEAATRLGDPLSERFVDDALVASRSHPDAMEQLLIQVALGDARREAGRWSAALSAYAGAAALGERSASTISDELVRARHGAARARAHDGALRTIVRSETGPALADALLRWSTRRKSLGVPGPSTPWRRPRPAAGDAIVDYLVIGGDLWAVTVTAARAAAVHLPMSAAAVDSLARRLRAPMAAVYGGRVDLARVPVDSEASRRLYDGLVGPIERELEATTRLRISPDGPVHVVPFDALMAATGQYVLDRWAITLTQSVNTSRARPLPATAALLLVAGDAPGAGLERALVGSAWKGRPIRVLEGPAASEAAVRRAAQHAGILHVVAHARSDERDPLSSHLALGADAIHDGLLHYAEIRQLGQRHSLVVLNGCETSAGELLGGSGFMSLARAFLVSGSDAVIATQWPVGEASAPLVARMYREIRAGQPLDEALRRAKQELRREAATAHPFFWASHVLIEGAPLRK